MRILKGAGPEGFELRGAEETYKKSGFNEPEIVRKKLKGAPARFLHPGEDS